MSESLIASKVLLLLWVANGAPIITARSLGKKFDTAIDFGIKLADHQPLFGYSKTWRGIIAAFACTVPVAVIIGFEVTTALLLVAASMAGDLLSSFSKRRLKMAPSKRALLLDQIPEALLPVSILVYDGILNWLTGCIVIIAFVITDMLLSRLLYRWHIRKKPY